jgi:hypothetical protein
MLDRFSSGLLILIGLALPIAGCGSSEVDEIAVTPTTVTFGGVGLTAQLTATGTYGHGTGPSTTQNITDQVTWSTVSPDVATVSATGLVTSTGPGTVSITASIKGYTGTISASSLVTVTVTSTTGPNQDVTALAIIPGSQTLSSPNQTSQFIAIGTTSSGATEDLTSKVAWSSSDVSVATITTGAGGGLASSVGQGSTTITAIETNADSSVATGTAQLTVSGGTSEPVTALTLIPNSESLSASGQTGQLIAIGTSGTSGLTENVTDSPQITWSSSIQSVATVSSGLATGNGVVSGVSQGQVTITAQWTNPDKSVVTAESTVNVQLTAAPEPLLSLTVIPSGIAVGNLQGTGNFLAIGTFSTVPFVRDLTNTVQWISTAPEIFPVSTDNTVVNPGAPGGVVTAYGNGSAVIVAEATSPDGTIQTATATFSCPLVLPNPPLVAGSCYVGSEAPALLSTVTVYNEGLNTTNWLVTAPSATGTPNVIHCGPGSAAAGLGGSVCTATYPINGSVKLTATQPAGAAGTFGGWSSSCTTINPNPSTAAGPNTCTLPVTTLNQSVGAIFN